MKRHAPYESTLNDYPLYYEELGPFRPAVYRLGSLPRMDAVVDGLAWMARRLIRCGWVVRRYIDNGK